MSASSSRRPETRSTAQQSLIEKRKLSVQHRHIHYLLNNPSSEQLLKFSDDSCEICNSPEYSNNKFYKKFRHVVTRFDPNITISGFNQTGLFEYIRDKPNRTPENLANLLKTLTFWKIPANFQLLAEQITHRNIDITIGEVAELTAEQKDTYETEVETVLGFQQQDQPSPFHSLFPPTPAYQTYTPLNRKLIRADNLQQQVGSLLQLPFLKRILEQPDQETPLKGKGAKAERLTIRTRDSIEPSDSDSPIPVQKQNQNLISPDDSTDEVASNEAEKADTDSEPDTESVDEQYFQREEEVSNDESADPDSDADSES